MESFIFQTKKLFAKQSIESVPKESNIQKLNNLSESASLEYLIQKRPNLHGINKKNKRLNIKQSFERNIRRNEEISNLSKVLF